MDIPKLVSKLNVFSDSTGLLRVKSKFGRWSDKKYHPILLSKSSVLTEKLIDHYHVKNCHCGLFQLVNLVRKQFWIECSFSVVKKTYK